MGRKPIVVIADPDILRQVMVKEFSSFPNRLVRAMPSGNHVLHAPQSSLLTANLCVSAQKLVITSKPMSDCLLFLRDDTWKRVRSVLTPSFSAAKMKEVRCERVC